MTRARAALAAAILVALVALGCGGRPEPGDAQCVDDRGRSTTCPDRW